MASIELSPESSSTPKPQAKKMNKRNEEASKKGNEGEHDSMVTKGKRKGPKNEWDFLVLIVDKKGKRCQHCRKDFQQHPPRNLMIGKFEEYIYSNRQGEGKGRRNFYYHIDRSCITPAYKFFTWGMVKVSEPLRCKLHSEQKQYLLSVGIKVPT